MYNYRHIHHSPQRLQVLPVQYDGFSYTDKLFSHSANTDAFYKTIEDSLPPIFTRQTASIVIGGLISPKTFANLDSKGQGPPVKGRIGTKVAYERESFIVWLRGRLKGL